MEDDEFRVVATAGTGLGLERGSAIPGRLGLRPHGHRPGPGRCPRSRRGPRLRERPGRRSARPRGPTSAHRLPSRERPSGASAGSAAPLGPQSSQTGRTARTEHDGTRGVAGPAEAVAVALAPRGFARARAHAGRGRARCGQSATPAALPGRRVDRKRSLAGRRSPVAVAGDRARPAVPGLALALIARTFAERLDDLLRRPFERALDVALATLGELSAQLVGSLAKRRVLCLPLRAVGDAGASMRSRSLAASMLRWACSRLYWASPTSRPSGPPYAAATVEARARVRAQSGNRGRRRAGLDRAELGPQLVGARPRSLGI